MAAKAPILCEINATQGQAADLAYIASFCAKQAGLNLEVIGRVQEDAKPTVTLHLKPAQASSDHPVWCLVCRMACFYPQARVGALVHAAGTFVTRRRGLRHTA